eukprot:TRINITY_DN40503_c0_g1_i1.p1 TRINITY_DN40503_c0_g1~~TRINITY_DN40503_c0_g1_i1.p1  ORF type:complete len:434 (-),score=75.22 TRINITY_DN40503_c0_g1_i1:6-1307(-)
MPWYKVPQVGVHNEEMDADMPQKASEPVIYEAKTTAPMIGEPLKVGNLWHFGPERDHKFRHVTLSLYINGLAIKYGHDGGEDGQDEEDLITSWSPFALVNAIRLHSAEADSHYPDMLFFKVLLFHHGHMHVFATAGPDAELERAMWISSICCARTVFTQSLFPNFALRTGPLLGSSSSSTRLLAGYLLMCEYQAVHLLFFELHLRFQGVAYLEGYASPQSTTAIMDIPIDATVSVSKAQGVDGCCFSIGRSNFAARTCAEKELWLRVVQNLKVKVLHSSHPPTPAEINLYRASILEHVQRIETYELDFSRAPLLPRAARADAHPLDASGNSVSPENGQQQTSDVSLVERREVSGPRMFEVAISSTKARDAHASSEAAYTSLERVLPSARLRLPMALAEEDGPNSALPPPFPVMPPLSAGPLSPQPDTGATRDH